MATQTEPKLASDEAVLAQATRFKDVYQFMGFDALGNCESEIMAAQTLTACPINYKARGECFSYAGKNLAVTGGNGLVDNPKGYAKLLKTLCVEIVRDAKPNDSPEFVTNGKVCIIKFTEDGLALLKAHLDNEDKRKKKSKK